MGWGIIYFLCKVILNFIVSSNSSGVAIMMAFFYTYIIILYIFIPLISKKLSSKFFEKTDEILDGKGILDNHLKELRLILFLVIVISIIVRVVFLKV